MSGANQGDPGTWWWREKKPSSLDTWFLVFGFWFLDFGYWFLSVSTGLLVGTKNIWFYTLGCWFWLVGYSSWFFISSTCFSFEVAWVFESRVAQLRQTLGNYHLSAGTSLTLAPLFFSPSALSSGSGREGQKQKTNI